MKLETKIPPTFAKKETLPNMKSIFKNSDKKLHALI